MGPTAEELKVLLESPLVLFVLMLAGSFTGAITQIWKARRAAPPGGEKITVLGYFRDYLPETLAMLGGNVIAFGALILSDQLNYVSATSLGWVVNSAADLVRKGGRSEDIASSTGGNS